MFPLPCAFPFDGRIPSKQATRRPTSQQPGTERVRRQGLEPRTRGLRVRASACQARSCRVRWGQFERAGGPDQGPPRCPGTPGVSPVVSLVSHWHGPPRGSISPAPASRAARAPRRHQLATAAAAEPAAPRTPRRTQHHQQRPTRRPGSGSHPAARRRQAARRSVPTQTGRRTTRAATSRRVSAATADLRDDLAQWRCRGRVLVVPGVVGRQRELRAVPLAER